MKPIFPITDKKLIESYIPHRSPIVMVDKLIDFTENYIIGGLKVLEDNIFVEDMNFKAIQKKAKKTERSDKTIITSDGKEVFKYKKKKRFGKSLNNKAPAMLISIIDRKLKYNSNEIHKVDTKSY